MGYVIGMPPTIAWSTTYYRLGHTLLAHCLAPLQVIALDLELLAELSSFDPEDGPERQQLATAFFSQCGLTLLARNHALSCMPAGS